MSKKLLVITANSFDEDKNYLKCLKEEGNGIQSLFLCNEGKQLNYLPLANTEIKIINATISSFKPNFLHFSGHSDRTYLKFNGGKRKAADFAKLLNLLCNVEFVFLNSCYSENAAEELMKNGVKVVIGTSKAVGDNLAKNIALSFYKYLSDSQNVYSAFKAAKDSHRVELLKVIEPERHSEEDGEAKDYTDFPWKIYGEEASKKMYLLPHFPTTLADAPQDAEKLFFVHHKDQAEDINKIKNKLSLKSDKLWINSYCSTTETQNGINPVLKEMECANIVCLIVNGSNFLEVWSKVSNGFYLIPKLRNKKVLFVKYDVGWEDFLEDLNSRNLNLIDNCYPKSEGSEGSEGYCVVHLKIPGKEDLALDNIVKFLLDSIKKFGGLPAPTKPSPPTKPHWPEPMWKRGISKQIVFLVLLSITILLGVQLTGGLDWSRASASVNRAPSQTKINKPADGSTKGEAKVINQKDVDPIEASIPLSYNTKPAWYADANGYAFYYNGVFVKDATSAQDGDDLVLFHKKVGKTFRLENYQNSKNSKLNEAKIETKFTLEKALWSAHLDGYAFYYMGEKVKDATAAKDGDDLVLFYKKMNKTFRFENYQNSKNGRLNIATIESKYTLEKPIWSAHPDGYAFYYIGEKILNATTAKDGEDLILFHKKVGKTFRFEDYHNSRDGKLRIAEHEAKFTLDKPLWLALPDGYAFYYNGERIMDASPPAKDGDDLILYHGKVGKTFRFVNYQNSRDNKLRIAKIETNF